MTSERNGKKRNRSRFFFDYTLLFIVIFLLCFGLVMLYSVSSYDANLKFGRSTYYLEKQVQATIIGIVVRHQDSDRFSRLSGEWHAKPPYCFV